MQDVIHDIQVIEEDVKDVEQKCEKVNCGALYDAIVATFKLIYDILITSIKEQFNYNDKEANRLIYHTTHFLLMDALIKKYNIPQMKAQILISIYNSQHNILF